jgi:hypothetical protein
MAEHGRGSASKRCDVLANGCEYIETRGLVEQPLEKTWEVRSSKPYLVRNTCRYR